MQLHLLQILPLSAWRFSTSLSPRCSNFASANQNILAVFNADFIPFRLPPLRFLFTFSSNCAQFFHVPHHNASPLHPESNPTKFTQFSIFLSSSDELDFTLFTSRAFAPDEITSFRAGLLQMRLTACSCICFKFSHCLLGASNSRRRCHLAAPTSLRPIKTSSRFSMRTSFRSDCRRSAFSSLFHRTAPNFSTFHTTTRLHSIRSQTPRRSLNFLSSFPSSDELDFTL
jgi:hypothetical protein